MGSQRAGFGPRVLPDGSVFFNAYGCAFYRLTAIGSDNPRLDNVSTLETAEAPREPPGRIRGSCGIPVVFENYWLMPVGQLHAVIVIDIANPAAPREVFRWQRLPHSIRIGSHATYVRTDSCSALSSAVKRASTSCGSTRGVAVCPTMRLSWASAKPGM
jgi:hypothetical protein